MSRPGLAALPALLAAGCVIDVDYGDTAFTCVEDPRCPPGLACVDGVCRSGGDAADAAPDAANVEQVVVVVAATDDDAEEVLATGLIAISSDSLEMAVDDGGADVVVGMRFAGIQIPPGASVVAARVQFSALEVATGAPATLTVRAQAADDAPAFKDVLADLSGRATTSASTAWSVPDWPTIGARGQAEQTPDLLAVIQEVIDRPGWAAGNAIVILVVGQGRRPARSFDSIAVGLPPELTIEFTLTAAPAADRPARSR